MKKTFSILFLFLFSVVFCSGFETNAFKNIAEEYTYAVCNEKHFQEQSLEFPKVFSASDDASENFILNPRSTSRQVSLFQIAYLKLILLIDQLNENLSLTSKYSNSTFLEKFPLNCSYYFLRLSVLSSQAHPPTSYIS